MKNVYIYCEGPTEDAFINEVMYPYFLERGIIIRSIICETKRTPSRKYKGGVSDYRKIKKELVRICRDHHNEYVTTMFDYYGMPDNTPGINYNSPDIEERIEAIESIINDDIGQRNCRFHFMVHEFEGLLFSDPDSFGLIAENDIVEQIRDIRNSFSNPEQINNSPETAPSKRIIKLIPNYAKVLNGTRIAKHIGIGLMMDNCPHFREWVTEIAEI